MVGQLSDSVVAGSRGIVATISITKISSYIGVLSQGLGWFRGRLHIRRVNGWKSPFERVQYGTKLAAGGGLRWPQWYTIVLPAPFIHARYHRIPKDGYEAPSSLQNNDSGKDGEQELSS
ncbi:hypothetical protein DL93DRAFT_2095770 [Clavulina sp. PMI_390]|nr:hypothetical protein DL93DRAFT_2095770 [Clavulina sp. PMI_390]